MLLHIEAASSERIRQNYLEEEEVNESRYGLGMKRRGFPGGTGVGIRQRKDSRKPALSNQKVIGLFIWMEKSGRKVLF